MAKVVGVKILANNKKAHFDYFLSEFVEAGLALTGTEIKSLRKNGATMKDSYIVFKAGEAFVIGLHIAPYEKGNIFNHDPERTRKLLLHKTEIRKMFQTVKELGLTVVPTKIYLHDGLAKIEIALAKGKKNYDKKETIKERDIQREVRKEY